MTEKIWENEPNYKTFMLGDYHCVIIRNRSLGHLCGYVGVSYDHPFYAKHYSEFGELVRVHGELTYSAYGIKKLNENPNMWYLGFDCAHYGDFVPSMENLFHFKKEEYAKSYKTIEFVENELVQLVDQLEEIKNENSKNQKGD